jgi:hypothetical protein
VRRSRTALFATHVQTVPFSGQFQNVMEPAIAAGAAGFVGIISDLRRLKADYPGWELTRSLDDILHELTAPPRG